MNLSPFNARLHVTGRAGGPALVEAGRMRFAVADRDRLAALREFGNDWLAIGAYVLLGLASEPEAAFAAYAGEATGRRGLLGRAEAQKRDQRWWQRAVLIARNDAHGFDSAQAGWLEGELIAHLQTAAHIECRNTQADSDASLHPFDADDMQAQFAVVPSLLWLLGAPLTDRRAADEPAPANGGGQASETEESATFELRRGGQPVATMTVTAEGCALKAGSLIREVFTSDRPADQATAASHAELLGSTTAAGDGWCRLEADATLPSPSRAAGVVLGRPANGRQEWRTADGTPLGEVAEQNGWTL